MPFGLGATYLRRFRWLGECLCIYAHAECQTWALRHSWHFLWWRSDGRSWNPLRTDCHPSHRLKLQVRAAYFRPPARCSSDRRYCAFARYPWCFRWPGAAGKWRCSRRYPCAGYLSDREGDAISILSIHCNLHESIQSGIHSAVNQQVFLDMRSQGFKSDSILLKFNDIKCICMELFSATEQQDGWRRLRKDFAK